jgi:hypothetical protein
LKTTIIKKVWEKVWGIKSRKVVDMGVVVVVVLAVSEILPMR